MLAYNMLERVLTPLRQSERERKIDRKSEGEREREVERGSERHVEYVFLFLKGMTGALAPFSYLVYNTNKCHSK